MKYLFVVITILSSFILYSNVIIAQPYIFKYSKDTAYISEVGLPVMKDKKINVGNGQVEKYWAIGGVSWDNTQSWVIEGIRRNFAATNISDTNDVIELEEDPGLVVFSPQKHKLFVYGEADNEGEHISFYNTLTLNSEFFFPINSLQSKYESMFLSQDENKLYFPFYDSLFHPHQRDQIKLAVISTKTHRIIKSIKFHDIGKPGAYSYDIANGKKGKAIVISYFKNKGTFYNIYNFENNSSSAFIYNKGAADPYFTYDGKYLILAESADSALEHGRIEIPNGKFLIYNVNEQKLVKTLSLPYYWDIKSFENYFPNYWGVYSFDNFPNNIYYYNNKSEKVITLNIDSLVNMSSAPIDSPKTIMYNLGYTYFTADFINGKIKYELGSGFTFIKPQSAAGDTLTYNEYDENNKLLGIFTFEKGYIKGSYTKNNSNKILHFARIDSEPN